MAKRNLLPVLADIVNCRNHASAVVAGGGFYGIENIEKAAKTMLGKRDGERFRILMYQESADISAS